MPDITSEPQPVPGPKPVLAFAATVIPTLDTPLTKVSGSASIRPADSLIPPQTTVRQPMEAMGTMAASLVVEGINAALEKRSVSATHQKMAPELAVHESMRSVP